MSFPPSPQVKDWAGLAPSHGGFGNHCCSLGLPTPQNPTVTREGGFCSALRVKKSEVSHFFPCREERKACSFAKHCRSTQPSPGLAVAASPACKIWGESCKISTLWQPRTPFSPLPAPNSSSQLPAQRMQRFSKEWEQVSPCCQGREPEQGAGM